MAGPAAGCTSDLAASEGGTLTQAILDVSAPPPRGAIDLVDVDGLVVGWVSESTPQLLVNGQRLDPSGLIERLYRPDVNAALGLPADPSIQLGFTYALPYAPHIQPFIADGAERTLVLESQRRDQQPCIPCTGGFGFGFCSPCPPSGFVEVTRPLKQEVARRQFSFRPDLPQGRVDRITSNGVVTGWVFDRDSLSTGRSQTGINPFIFPCGSGNSVASSGAFTRIQFGIARPDVNAAVGAAGNYGFEAQIDPAYLRGNFCLSGTLFDIDRVSTNARSAPQQLDGPGRIINPFGTFQIPIP